MKSFETALNKAHAAGLVPVEWRLPKFAIELANAAHSKSVITAALKNGTFLGLPVTEIENDQRAELICARPEVPDIKL